MDYHAASADDRSSPNSSSNALNGSKPDFTGFAVLPSSPPVFGRMISTSRPGSSDSPSRLVSGPASIESVSSEGAQILSASSTATGGASQASADWTPMTFVSAATSSA